MNRLTFGRWDEPYDVLAALGQRLEATADVDRLLADVASELGGLGLRDVTYVKVAGRCTYLYRAIDQHGQVIDVLVSARRDGAAERALVTRALRFGPAPVEVTTDRASVHPRVIDDLVPAARHVLEQHTNNVVEADHGPLKAPLRPMRGVKTISSLPTTSAGHAFVQNLRRGQPRTHHRRARPGPRPCRLHRARTRSLIPDVARRASSALRPDRSTQQCPSRSSLPRANSATRAPRVASRPLWLARARCWHR